MTPRGLGNSFSWRQRSRYFWSAIQVGRRNPWPAIRWMKGWASGSGLCSLRAASHSSQNSSAKGRRRAAARGRASLRSRVSMRFLIRLKDMISPSKPAWLNPAGFPDFHFPAHFRSFPPTAGCQAGWACRGYFLYVSHSVLLIVCHLDRSARLRESLRADGNVRAHMTRLRRFHGVRQGASVREIVLGVRAHVSAPLQGWQGAWARN